MEFSTRSSFVECNLYGLKVKLFLCNCLFEKLELQKDKMPSVQQIPLEVLEVTLLT